MRLSKSSPKFQLSWQPSIHILAINYLLLCVALACVYATGLQGTIQCVLSLLALSYVTLNLRRYWRRPAVRFISNGSTLVCQQLPDRADEIRLMQWQDWGFIFVLNAQLNGKRVHWLWLSFQLSELDKRNLRLMIRAQLKKVCPSMPSITTNPVL